MKTECLESTEVGTERNRRLNPGKFFFYLQMQVFKDCFETTKKVMLQSLSVATKTL